MATFPSIQQLAKHCEFRDFVGNAQDIAAHFHYVLQPNVTPENLVEALNRVLSSYKGDVRQMPEAKVQGGFVSIGNGLIASGVEIVISAKDWNGGLGASSGTLPKAAMDKVLSHLNAGQAIGGTFQAARAKLGTMFSSHVRFP